MLTLKKDLTRLIDDYWMNNYHEYPHPLKLKQLYKRKDELILPAPNLLVKSYKEWSDQIVAQDKRVYKTVYNNLIAVFGEAVTMDEVTPLNLTKLVDFWMRVDKRYGEPNCNSTMNKRWQILVKFFESREGEINPEWKKFKFKAPANPSDVNIFHLTEQEFKILWNYDTAKLSSNETFALQLYLLSCITSWRISDVVRARPDLLFKDGVLTRIRMTITKNKGKQSNVPLNSKAVELIKKIDWETKLTEQKIRENLYKVFKKVVPDMPPTWTESLQYYKMVGITAAHDYLEKYRLLNFNSSRKSFAILFARKLPADQVMYLGGVEANEYD